MKKLMAVAVLTTAIVGIAVILFPRTGRLVNPASPRIQAETKLKEVFIWYSSYTTHGPRYRIPDDLSEVREWSSSQNRQAPSLSFKLTGTKETINIRYIRPQSHTENEIVFLVDQPIPVTVRTNNGSRKELRYVGIYEDFTVATMESESGSEEH